MSRQGRVVIQSLILAGLCVPASAQETTADATPDASSAPTESKGILPIPDYTGDLAERRYLLGDWGGTRTEWADKGIQLEVDWTQYVQGVVDGGRDITTRYGGHLTYLINLDLMRMGVMEGALLNVRAETRYGNSVNAAAGPLLPVNTDAYFPLSDDNDIAITITDLVYTQFLSETFGVYLGKFDTLSGDLNEFAAGRGASQFMNSNLVFNAVTALSTPYSTLGVGVSWMPSPYITVTSSVYNTADSSTTSGFEDFGKGTSWASQAAFQYRLGHLPGGQSVGFSYSFDDDFAAIDGRFVFTPGEGLSVPSKSDTWYVYWNGWQYLYTPDRVEKPLVLTDGKADLQGVGVFARFGFADNDTNPVNWSGSIGLGGRGIIPGRLDDTCGIGYYYIDVVSSRLFGILDLAGSTQGFEAYYDIALTPAAALTFDVQVVGEPSGTLDTGVVLGARLGLTF